ncbi:pilus assembly protein TadG-related protein [Pseudooceanicola nanhaiensis]|uniref:pilus assembly protein TadG-related protein n=1 Tax=Pseudooceanicola nanhaiensis TaxID=375761 RepID=UPI0040586953
MRFFKAAARVLPRPSSDTEAPTARFWRDERGVMVPVVIFFLLIMLTVCGVGVDIMRQEMVRAKVQTTLDRAILAAADLDQQLTAEEVVKDYFDKSGILDYLTEVTVDQGASHRIVTARAQTQMKTQFLGSIGFPSFEIYAYGRAEESLGDAEISMVLDISGSMGSNQKIQRLRSAAKEFVDTVILDESRGAVSISLVPCTAQVNAGPAIMDRLNIPRKHAYSSCVLFADNDFDTTEINPATEYEQAEHFELYSSGNSGNGNNPITNPSCPMRSYEEIMAYSQDKQALKQRINQLTDRANTSIHLGMKWGVGMVDPSFRPVITDMVNNGLVDPAFRGRPTAWETGALKTVILMTDGENVDTYGIMPEAYGTPSMRYHWHVNSLMTWVQNNVDRSDWDEFYYRRSSSSNSDTLLDNVCDAAKDAGILVWSVGFEVNNHGAKVMKDCASSPNHFFRVEGVEITEAFRSIARQLNKLKLTQ